MVCKNGLPIPRFRALLLRRCHCFLPSLNARTVVRLQSKRFHTAGLKSAWNILFFGTDSFGLEILHTLNTNRTTIDPTVVKNLEVVCVPSKGITLPVNQYAVDRKLVVHEWPCCVPKDKFDLGVVAAFGHLIPSDVINAFPFGMINVHGSLLPRWRGAAPVIHAILNGDKQAGVTVMEIAPHRFDVGKILMQQSFDVPKNIKTNALTSMIAATGAQVLLQCLQDLENVLANGLPQDPTLVTKAPKVKPEKARIVWNEYTVSEIDKLYRALDESLTLYTHWLGNKVKLTDMEDYCVTSQYISSHQRQYETIVPGKIKYNKWRKTLFISCKDGWVEFKSAAAKGKPTMTALAFYNGFISKVVPDLQFFTSDNKS